MTDDQILEMQSSGSYRQALAELRALIADIRRIAKLAESEDETGLRSSIHQIRMISTTAISLAAGISAEDFE